MTFVCTLFFGIGALMVYAAWTNQSTGQALADLRGTPPSDNTQSGQLPGFQGQAGFNLQHQFNPNVADPSKPSMPGF